MTIPYGTDYPEAPWIDRDGEPIPDEGPSCSMTYTPRSPATLHFPTSTRPPR
jgi:hypothetical protein